jgi:hypothetical protein
MGVPVDGIPVDNITDPVMPLGQVARGQGADGCATLVAPGVRQQGNTPKMCGTNDGLMSSCKA